MIAKLVEFVLPHIMRAVRPKYKTNAKERTAEREFVKGLEVPSRKTAKPIVVAVVGLVGSGKTSVAKEIAEKIGAAVIEGDAIRIGLRARGCSFNLTYLIAENALFTALARGSNAVLDSDFVDAQKRASMRIAAKRAGARLVFVRTYCSFDIAIGRIMETEYRNDPADFFGGAWSDWKGSHKGAAVKTREMIRRLPHHYRWENEGGGRWRKKAFSFALFAEINTGGRAWKQGVDECVGKLLEG